MDRDIVVRSVTGVIIIIFFTTAFYFKGWLYLVLFSILMLGCLIEFFAMMNVNKYLVTISCLAASTFFFISGYKWLIGEFQYFINFVVSVFIFYLISILSLSVLINKNFNNRDIYISQFALIYIIIPFASFSYLISINEGIYLGMVIFILLWIQDSFAYLIGRKLGKRKLNVSLSPKKTWEGVIGGGVFTMLIAIVISFYVSNLDLIDCIVMGFLTIVFGTLGDLFQSKLKRESFIKDTSSILPGHGGILDRMDSFMFVSPVLFIYFNIFA